LPVNAAQEPGVSVIDQNIQYNGPADLYTLSSNPTPSTSDPAATLHSMGTNGGQVAAFNFDLARSIADAAIPQADEFRRLLRSIILLMIADSRSLP
jgi:hypothetical protein